MIYAMECNFDEILAQALAAGDMTKEMHELYCWFENYEPWSWNGEEYHIPDGRRLRPVYDYGDLTPDEIAEVSDHSYYFVGCELV